MRRAWSVLCAVALVAMGAAYAFSGDFSDPGSRAHNGNIIANKLTTNTIELGNLTDTTLSRPSAGTLAVEGVTVLENGGALGTPSSGTLTNETGLPISTGVSGLGAGVATFLATPSSANLAAAVTDETGSGALAFATSPSFTTPTLGAATATTINKVTLTAPATGSTLTVADGKTLTASNSITIAGTDSTTMTFPTTSGTIAALNINDQTLAGGGNVTALSQSTGNLTIDCGARPLQFITNGAAWTLTAPTNDGSCMLLVTNNATAGAITFSGFTVGTNTGDALTTTNGNKFIIQVARINGTATYSIKALQ